MNLLESGLDRLHKGVLDGLASRHLGPEVLVGLPVALPGLGAQDLLEVHLYGPEALLVGGQAPRAAFQVGDAAGLGRQRGAAHHPLPPGLVALGLVALAAGGHEVMDLGRVARGLLAAHEQAEVSLLGLLYRLR